MKKLYRINVLIQPLLAALCSRYAKHEAENGADPTVPLTPRGAGKICSFGVTVNPRVDRETEVGL